MVFLSVLMVASCMSVGTKVDQSQLSGFTRGVTTDNDVIASLGNPNSTAVNDDGSKVLIYMHVESQVQPATMIPIVGLFVGGAKSESTVLRISFDKSGKLASYTTGTTNGNYNTGLVDYSK